MKKVLFATLLAIACTAAGFSQTADDKDERNELGFTIGAEIVPDIGVNGSRLNVGNSIVYSLNYARRLTATENTALFLEFPAFAAPSHSVRNASGATPAPPVSLATFYITPSLRVNFKRQSRISPWLSFGGGYGLYEGSERLADGIINPDRFTSTGTLQWGGGVDVKTPVKVVFPIQLRLEVRDFYTFDSLNFNTGGTTDQHNVNVSGGFVFRW